MPNPRRAKIAGLRARADHLRARAGRPAQQSPTRASTPRHARSATARRTPMAPPEYVAPTYRGDVPIKIGSQTWGVSTGARWKYLGKPGSSAVWVCSSGGVVHLLREHEGKVVEAVLPPEIADQARQRYFPETHATAPSSGTALGPGPAQR